MTTRFSRIDSIADANNPDNYRKREYNREPSTPEKRSKHRSSSPVLSEEERDKRTVFVQQLAARLTEDELYDFMKRVGRVRDVRIVRDRRTGRSRGFGYVEYYEEQSVPLAIFTSGEKLHGIPIVISYTEAEKNRQAEADALAKQNRIYDPDYCQLQIRNIPTQIRESDIRILLQPYGYIESIYMRKDAAGMRHENGSNVSFTWIAQVAFKEHKSSKLAVEKLNGHMLEGSPISISPLTLAPHPDSVIAKHATVSSSAEDDAIDADKHLVLTSESRAELMQKLARSTDLSLKAANASQSTTITLLNAYDPDLETDPTWASILSEDVQSECSKFGQIISIQVLKSKAGEIHVYYTDPDSAQRAVAALNGRWFGGRKLTVQILASINQKSP